MARAKSKVKEITLTVVGLNYRLTKSQITKLEEHLPLGARVEREPDNDHDENAIAVWGTEKPFRNVKVGYIQRTVAHDLAPKIDDGTFHPHEVWLTEIAVSKTGIGGEGHVASLLVRL